MSLYWAVALQVWPQPYLPARQGADTLLIEQMGEVGGIATEGLMSHWTGNTKGGIYEEILDRSADLPDSPDKDFNGSPRQIINPEKLKTVLLEMLDEAGCRFLLYTVASAPIVEDGKLKGVIIENKSGPSGGNGESYHRQHR